MCEHNGTPLPGGIGVSLLRVYDGTGSPHVHLACMEGYYVIAGSGGVQTLNAKGYAETALAAGSVVWFGPGTIHRLVNGGGLTILTLMSNSGLPEAGDAVLTVPPEHLTDRSAYEKVTVLQGTGEERTESAMRRRDLALQGFKDIRDGGPEALNAFYAGAVELVRPLVGSWRQRWQDGAQRLADETGAALDALEAGDGGHLRQAELHHHDTPTEQGRHGMCGRLDVYDHLKPV